MKKAVIFDLDGTLIDSAIVILSILNKIRAERGFAGLSMTEVRPHLSKGGLKLVAESLAEAAVDPVDDLRLFREYYSVATQGEEIVFEGAFTLLEELRAAGFGLGICTNKPSHLCGQALLETGLGAHFQTVFTAGEGLPSKPDPSAYLACCAELGVRPEDTILVGDSEVDRDTALASGAQFILVTYGYPIGPVHTIEAAAKCDEAAEITSAVHSVFGTVLVPVAPLESIGQAPTLELTLGE